MFHFDNIIDRSQSSCEKWDKYKGLDVIPAWVADMDFRSPPCVIDALQKRVNEGVFGYTSVDAQTFDAIINFVHKRYGWKIEKEWILFTHGVVSSMNIACKSVGGESVLMTTPIYPHFTKAPKNMGQKVIAAPMIEKDGRWCIDFDALERLSKYSSKLFMLCNPYNPGGTVFTQKELTQLCAFCLEHNLIICSDEIHADLILNPNAKHIPIASLDERIAQQSITLMAPSKSFNIAGLQSSFVIIPNPILRGQFQKTMGNTIGGINLLGITAMRVAYEQGEPWLEALLVYLRENLHMVEQFVTKNPQLRLLSQDATFLAWIDATSLHVKSPYEFFLQHGVGLSDGAHFGDKNFVRLNFGTNKKTLKTILKRMQKAMDSLQ
ncbi:MAG: putative C-S lyase [Sulfurospirillum sp.]|nr:putative C-S lyase [Sulfurospirillum sp.]